MTNVSGTDDPMPLDEDNDTSGGEDDSSTERNGDVSHLYEDQKFRTLKI